MNAQDRRWHLRRNRAERRAIQHPLSAPAMNRRGGKRRYLKGRRTQELRQHISSLRDSITMALRGL